MCKTALTDGHQRAIRSGKISVSRRGRRGREGGRKWEGGKGTCMYTTKYYQSTPPSGKVKSYIITGKCYSMGERRRVLHRRVFLLHYFIEPVTFAHCVWPPRDQIDVRYIPYTRKYWRSKKLAILLQIGL